MSELVKKRFNLPAEWKIDVLHNLCNLINDGTHFTPRYLDNGIPFLRVTDVQENIINLEHLKYISEEEHSLLSKRCKPEKGDLLLSKNGSIGISKIVDWDWEFSIFVSLALIKPNKSVLDVNFLQYYLDSELTWWQIFRRAKQGTVTNLHLEEIREIEIPKLSLSEQCKIARILSTVDTVIEKTEAAIAKYKAIKSGMMRDLFTRGIDLKTGKLRPRYDDAPLLYKKSELGWVPREWEVLEIKECIDSIMSNVDKHIKEDETNILLCNYMDVYSNRYLSNKISFRSGSVNASENQRFSLRYHDVIITKDSETPDDIAVPSVLVENIKDLICGYHLCILRPKNLEKLNGLFLMLQLQLQEINNQFAVKANGSTRYGLTIDAIENAMVKIPNNIKEQEKIAKRLRAIDINIRNEEVVHSKHKQLKQALMSDLLTGKVRVKYEEEKTEAI